MRSSRGVSTYTTVHSASSASGQALAGAHQLLRLRIGTDRHQHALARQARRASGPAGSAAPRPRRDRRPGAARARAAPSGSACGRSARRRWRPRSAMYTLPARSRASRSSGGRSISSMSSASSKTRSGSVSRWRTPVICATRSLRLSRCCTLTVVQTLMPASSSSSTSCQRLGWRGAGSPPTRLECASSSTSRIVGRRASARIQVELLAHDAAVARPAAAAAAPALRAAARSRRGRAARRSRRPRRCRRRARCAPPRASRRSCRRPPMRRRKSAAARAWRAPPRPGPASSS